MGCASSKRIEVAADVYRPAPSSFAVFDINSIEEPWLLANGQSQLECVAKSHVPDFILQKLNTLDGDDAMEAPQSWAEVSKALENLKPTLDAPIKPISPASSPPPLPPSKEAAHVGQKPRKTLSFHTLEELDATLGPKSNPEPHPPLHRREHESSKTESEVSGFRTVKENIFLVRDRLEREKEGKQSNIEKMMSLRRDPLGQFPEKCPPGGSETVVIYTTSLGGIRRTFEDCNRVREVLDWRRVVYEERDVSLHGEYLKELKELLGEEGRVPRMFVKGRYVGGVEEVVELNEKGRLGRILSCACVERGVGRQACEGCGGARFVPCLECGGSCKITVAVGGDGDGDGHTLIRDGDSGSDKKKKTETRERCPMCNENGLVHCPTCKSVKLSSRA